MGSDVIYMQRKANSRIALVIVSWAIILGASLFVFNEPSFPLLLVASLAGMLLYIGIEYRHASNLVKGFIETVRVADLTKAIYWLSIVSSGRAPTQESFYYRNATKVVQSIDGELETKWNEIMKKHKPFNLKLYIFFVVSSMACPFGIAIGQNIRQAWMMWFFIVLAFALILAFVIIGERRRKDIESFVRDKEMIQGTRVLAQELISWTSQRTQTPIRVLLAETNYSAVKGVGSIYDVAIVQIEPKDPTQSRSSAKSEKNQ